MEAFADKTAVITGGASGIGRAVAERLAQRGANVVLADINKDLLEKTTTALTSAGYKAKAVTVDVRDAQAVRNMIHEVVAESGRLDYLFNNAGVVVFGLAEDYSIDEWRSIIDTNLYGAVNGVAAAYPLMLKQGSGHIINTASLSGLIPTGGLIPYVASKYGIVGLSNALRVEGADFGVRVSVVCPGLIDTPMKNSKFLKLDSEKVLAAAPSLLPVEQCARAIVQGVERNDAFIVVTPMAKILWLLHRLSPNLVMWIWRQQMKKFRSFRLQKG